MQERRLADAKKATDPKVRSALLRALKADKETPKEEMDTIALALQLFDDALPLSDRIQFAVAEPSRLTFASEWDSGPPVPETP